MPKMLMVSQPVTIFSCFVEPKYTLQCSQKSCQLEPSLCEWHIDQKFHSHSLISIFILSSHTVSSI
jgi:hypothetical protein